MTIIAGPCGIESEEQFFNTVKFLTENGVDYIRGGVWKYRSIPSTYQGSDNAMSWVYNVKSKFNFKFVCEIFDITDRNEEFIEQCVDVIQVGSRSMYNTALLKAISKRFSHKPVILKRHFSAGLKEFVNHSLYLACNELFLCLRGTQSLHPQEQRFVPDVTDIQRLKELSEHRIIYDVSHSACDRRYIEGVTQAALAMNPYGLMVEVHPDPMNALSDERQQLDFHDFLRLKKCIGQKQKE